METKHNTGVLLCNLGTPDSPSQKDVARYLREFLMDKFVISVPVPLRYVLVNGLIAPFRSGHSSKMYSRVWGKEGSPLKHNTMRLTNSLSEKSGMRCEMAMRYGNPSMQSVIEKMIAEGIDRIIFLPLYPHYTQSTFHSCIHMFRNIMLFFPDVKYSIVDPFYHHSSYVDAVANTIKACPDSGDKDFVLFSFHGIPVSHMEADYNRGWSIPYNEQCRRSAALIAQKAGLKKGEWGISFQSRLGKGKWTGPYTNEILQQLPSRDVRNLLVVAPSFVTDCLETIEELGAEGRDIFLRAGGEGYSLVPCLNDDEMWVDAISQMLKEAR